MRIAIANWSRRRVGGTEVYLDEIIRGLHRRGHELGFFCEGDAPADRQPINLPARCPVWCVSESGMAGALANLKAWRPDVVYVHRLSLPTVDESVLQVAPAVLFPHDYQRTCISGTKAFTRPVMRPCRRKFGVCCLALYFPRGCGSEIVGVWRAFRRTSRQLNVARRYRAIIVQSRYMRAEYLKHGFAPDSVHTVRYDGAGEGDGEQASTPAGEISAAPVRLLFIGRMQSIKGGDILLDALPAVAAALGRPVNLVCAGDGEERRNWEQHARGIVARHCIHVEFPGWVNQEQIQRLALASDLLVFPSVWPEPFGRIGREVGLMRLPAAAFAVGGNGEWLIDGVNGYLAPADPPSAAKLAAAIAKCLRDSATHSRLRDGALRIARRFSLDNHLEQLSTLFAAVARQA